MLALRVSVQAELATPESRQRAPSPLAELAQRAWSQFAEVRLRALVSESWAELLAAA